MRRRVYYRVELKLRSALSIGAADSTLTDSDVILDSRGKPLIPATSLAGVYRSYFDEVTALQMFGEVHRLEKGRILGNMTAAERRAIVGEDGTRCDESAVRIYDATWVDGNSAVTTRDSVALEDRVAKDKLKFDRQAVERGGKFVTYVEVTDVERCPPASIERVFGALHVGDLLLGSKTTRGFGSVAVVDCIKREFGPDEVEQWLEFDMFADRINPSWSLGTNITKSVHGARSACDVELELDLELRGGVSIREYSTEPGEEGDSQPDYSQMIVHGMKDEHGNDIPILPGTSWAGAFRERYESFSNAENTRTLFGCVESDGDEEESKRSRISFSETELSGGDWVSITHNAIDRFTGGTMTSALFTERTYMGGSTKLIIRIDDASGLDDEAFIPLVCTLVDLNNGMLAVGGLASIGRGLFRINGATLKVRGVSCDGFFEALCEKSNVGGYIVEVNDIGAVARMFSGEVDA